MKMKKNNWYNGIFINLTWSATKLRIDCIQKNRTISIKNINCQQLYGIHTQSEELSFHLIGTKSKRSEPRGKIAARKKFLLFYQHRIKCSQWCSLANWSHQLTASANWTINTQTLIFNYLRTILSKLKITKKNKNIWNALLGTLFIFSF